MSKKAVEAVIMANGIPESNAKGALYSMIVQELASQLVNEVRLLHSSVSGGGNVIWRTAFSQMFDAQTTMRKLDEALVAMVVPRGIEDE